MRLEPGDTEYIERTLKELINIKSLSGHEGHVAEYIKRELEEIHKTHPFSVPPKIDRFKNVHAVFGRGKRKLILNSHTDTVARASRAKDEWRWHWGEREAGERKLHGLGASDCKAGVAAMLFLAKHLAENADGQEERGSVLFAFTSMEEGVPKGRERYAKAFINSLNVFSHPDACIVCEPTMVWNRRIGYAPYVLVGCRGRYRKIFDFKSKEDAIHFIKRIMVTKMASAVYFRKRRNESISAIRAEIGTSEEPPWVMVDYRTLPNTERGEAEGRIERYLLVAKDRDVVQRPPGMTQIKPTEIHAESDEDNDLLKIHIMGRSAHTAKPWTGINALYRAIRLIDPKVLCGKFRDFRVQSLQTEVQGSAYNQVPEYCELVLRGPHELHDDFTRLIPTLGGSCFTMPDPKNHSKRPTIGAEMYEGQRGVDHYRGYVLDPDKSEELVMLLKGEVHKVFSANVPKTIALGGADTEFFYDRSGRESPTVEFGPGLYYQCHTPDEYVLLGQIYKWVQVMVPVIEHYLY